MRSRQCESGHAVVKRSSVPSFGRVAIGAIRDGKCRTGRGMGRIIGLLPGRQVALRVSAIRRRNRQIVVVVDMAGSAGDIGVPVGKQKAGGGVVKVCSVPALGGVAVGAICDGKCRAGRGVGRIIGLLPGCQVALRISAIRGRNRQIVVVADMAGSAGDIGVPVRQGESRGVMIELCAEPTVERVARATGCGELRAYVVGICRFLIIHQMA